MNLAIISITHFVTLPVYSNIVDSKAINKCIFFRGRQYKIMKSHILESVKILVLSQSVFLNFSFLIYDTGPLLFRHAWNFKHLIQSLKYSHHVLGFLSSANKTSCWQCVPDPSPQKHKQFQFTSSGSGWGRRPDEYTLREKVIRSPAVKTKPCYETLLVHHQRASWHLLSRLKHIYTLPQKFNF